MSDKKERKARELSEEELLEVSGGVSDDEPGDDSETEDGGSGDRNSAYP